MFKLPKGYKSADWATYIVRADASVSGQLKTVSAYLEIENDQVRVTASESIDKIYLDGVTFRASLEQ